MRVNLPTRKTQKYILVQSTLSPPTATVTPMEPKTWNLGDGKAERFVNYIQGCVRTVHGAGDWESVRMFHARCQPYYYYFFFAMERLEMFLGNMKPKAEVDVHKKSFTWSILTELLLDNVESAALWLYASYLSFIRWEPLRNTEWTQPPNLSLVQTGFLEWILWKLMQICEARLCCSCDFVTENWSTKSLVDRKSRRGSRLIHRAKIQKLQKRG